MRASLIGLLCFLMALLLPALAATTPESVELSKHIKIAEVHMHLRPETSKALLEKMDRNGVEWGGR